MPLVGLKSIVFKPASAVWSGENPPSSELEARFDSLPELFKLEIKNEQAIRDTLDKITLDNSLQPSQDLRRLYWSGQFCALLNDHRQAFELFDRARQLAEAHRDWASILEMTLNAATQQHDGLHYSDALDTYRTMLDIWQRAPLASAERRLDTEIQIRALICRQEWLIGEFDLTLGNFASTFNKALNAPKAQQSTELLKQTANMLWMLALTLRAQSDQRDGEANYLKQAIRRLLRARGLYQEVGADANNFARFNVQLAEIYYDLAEVHLQRNAKESSKSMRIAGEPLLRQALEYLVGSDDDAAILLAEIANLRHDIMWPQLSTPEEIEERLIFIERRAEKMRDQFTLAKAATLRAEWLMTLGEFEKARTALTLAIEGFGLGGKGMATRAERLMRQLPSIHEPESHYGGADPERNGHN